MAATSRTLALAGCGLMPLMVLAGVLPEDRADALYHSYNGGGVEVNGPSILVRKGDNKSFSVSGNYYVDSISSASIDVLTQGSPYSEERTQTSVSVDYLRADTILTAGYTNSEESDYAADTLNFAISQSMFGDMTTVSLGYALGNDDVMRNGDTDFGEKVDRQQFLLGMSQVLSKSLLFALNYENVTEEGYLNNPYRSVRYIDLSSGLGYSFEAERYPHTRTSNALAAKFRYYLPYRAALGFGYRYFIDDWDIKANTANIEYSHPFANRWHVEASYRYYTQTQADFYSDLYPRANHQNFLARDKELSNFHDHSIGLGLSYDLVPEGMGVIDRATLNARYNRFWFNYEDYTDLTQNAAVGDEPGYEFTADVIQLYLSAWF